MKNDAETLSPSQTEKNVLLQRIAELEDRCASAEHELEQLRTYEDALAFKTLVENAPDGVFFTDTFRTVVYANQAAQSIFGYGEDLMGMHTSTLYAEEEHERQPVILRELRDNGVWRGNVNYCRKDGQTSLCQISAFVFRNSDGTVRGNAIIVRDINDIKQVENSLQQFQTLVELAPDGIALVNLDQTVAYVNPSIRSMLRLDGDVVGLDTVQMFADPLEYIEQVRNTYLTYGTWSGAVTMRRKDGTIFPGQSSVFVIKEPESHTPQMLAVILRDMTEQHRVYEKLRLRETVLGVVGNSAEHFLRTNDVDIHIQTMLEQLGQAVNVSRVYLFENHTDAQGTLLTSQRYEWVADGIEAQLGNPDLENLPLLDAGLGRWVDTLSHGYAIYGNVVTFPSSEREILEVQNIKSIITVPIFVSGNWWGFLGFDDCERERDWAAVDVDALKAAASIVGSAMQRRQDEERHDELQQQIIEAQRVALHELSTPMMPLVEGVVAMPLVGSVDTNRAQRVMETLLEGVAKHQATIAILDITGVPVVDTQVANALIQAAHSVRLLGAHVIFTGIGPTMAQTLVNLGVDLKGITTYSSLQSAMIHALKYLHRVR